MNMILALFCSGALGGPDGIQLDADGIKVDGLAMDSPLLQVRRTAGTSLLASSNAVEPLSAALSVEIESKNRVVLQPGLRLTRVKEGYVLETHGRRRVSLESEGRTYDFESGVVLKSTEKGLDLGSGRAVVSGAVTARVLPASKTEIAVQAARQAFVASSRPVSAPMDLDLLAPRPSLGASGLQGAGQQPQDDADANLNAMSEAARRLLESRRRNGPQQGPGYRRSWGEYPFRMSALEWGALQQLFHVSPNGF